MSLAPAEPLWSDLQVSWLQAMGHAVYLDRDQPEPEPVRRAPAIAAVDEVAPAPRRQAPPSPDTAAAIPSGPRRAAPQPPPTAPAAPARPVVAAGPGGRRRIGLPDRLQIALLRATGRNPDDPDVRAAMQAWPLDQLRADPAAKRALWPQLRALRKARPG